MFDNVQSGTPVVVSFGGLAPTIHVGQAVLQKVVAKLGGVYAAAGRLGITASVISCYLAGSAPVPDTILLRAVDLVLDEFQQNPSAGSQPFTGSKTTR